MHFENLVYHIRRIECSLSNHIEFNMRYKIDNPDHKKLFLSVGISSNVYLRALFAHQLTRLDSPFESTLRKEFP